MQSLQIVPAKGALNGILITSSGNQPTQRLAVGRKAGLQLINAENLGCCCHGRGTSRLTFGRSLWPVCCQDYLTRMLVAPWQRLICFAFLTRFSSCSGLSRA